MDILVGLRLSRYDHTGPCSPHGIGRTAYATQPDFIIADEPVSSLDVTTCSKIIHLLRHLKDTYQITMLLISHDLHLLAHVSDRIVEM